MKRIGQVLGMTALLALGTASAQSGSQYLYFRVPGEAITARVTGDSVNSADLQLTRDGKTLRGRAFGNVVFLGLNGEELGGTVGNTLSRLSFEREGETLKARGSFAGNLSELTLGPEGLTGTVGRCSYDLEAVEDVGYRGSRSCGGTPERPVVLSIPPALSEQGPAMTLAVVALVLGVY